MKTLLWIISTMLFLYLLSAPFITAFIVAIESDRPHDKFMETYLPQAVTVWYNAGRTNFILPNGTTYSCDSTRVFIKDSNGGLDQIDLPSEPLSWFALPILSSFIIAIFGVFVIGKYSRGN